MRRGIQRLRRATRSVPQWVRLGPLLVGLALTGLLLVLGSPASADPMSCDDPPTPERTDAGLVGMIDPSTGNGLAGTIYLEHHYSGQVWNAYDVGKPPLCTDPGVTVSDFFGNLLFDVGKLWTGATNALHYMVAEGGIGSGLDHLVQAGSGASFHGFTVPFLSVALVLVAIAAFRFAFAGKLAGLASLSGRAVAGLALVAASALSPLLYTTFFDDVLVGGVTEAQQAIDKQLYNGADVPYRHVLPQEMHEHIVYQPWLRGQFGDENSPAARDLGPRVVDAQACTWSETRANTCDPAKKQQDFKNLANQVKDSGGDYAAFTGESNGRVGAGMVSAYEGSLFGGLQVAANSGVLLGQLTMRFLVLFGPVIGIVMFHAGVARRVLRFALGAVLLGLLLVPVAHLHAFMMIKTLDSSMSMIQKLVVTTLVTLIVWWVARPVSRILGLTKSITGDNPGAVAKTGKGAFDQYRRSRMMRAIRRESRKNSGPSTRWWRHRPAAAAGDDVGDDSGDGPPGTVWATATRPESSVRPPAMAPAGAGATAGALSMGAGRGAGSSGDTSDGSGSRGPPSGNGSGGGNTAPGAVRAEATRLHPETTRQHSRDSGVDGVTSDQRAGIPGSGAPRALPAGSSSGSDQQERPESGDGDEPGGEVIVPSEFYADDSSSSRKYPEKPNNPVYRPSAGRVESGGDTAGEQSGVVEGRGKAGPRPETQDSQQWHHPDQPDTNADEGNH